jgi:diguanylate cyclase (GGDEF)-like protein/PAS domain S-box-containing protein
MNDFLNSQSDYIYMLLSLIFIVFASISFTISKDGNRFLPWRCLTLFGIIHGACIWLTIPQNISGSGDLTRMFSVYLLIISNLLLMEFGRGSSMVFWGKMPGVWIYIPVLLLAAPAITGTPEALYCTAITILGLAGGLWAALALYLAAGSPGQEKHHSIAAAGILLALYTAATILPYCSIPTTGGKQANALIIIRLSAAAAAALCLWIYSRRCTAISTASHYSKSRRKYSIMLTVLIFMLLSIGWLVTQSLSNRAYHELVSNSNHHVNLLSSHLQENLSEAEHGVFAMAGSPWIAPALLKGGKDDMDRANTVLDRYNKAMQNSVCYLLDINGKAIASSNRNLPVSFVGKYYTYSPYFQQSAAGGPGRYFDIRIASGKREFYTSSPVEDDNGKIIGVAVIKKDIGNTEKDFQKHAYCFFINPQGVIFLASQPDMLLRSLWPLAVKERQELAQSLQFGPGPFNPVLGAEPKSLEMINLNGEQLLATRQPTGIDGWSIVMLSHTHQISTYRILSITIVTIFFLLIISFYMALLSSMASEAKIAASERHYHSLVEGSPNCVKLLDREGRLLSINGSGLSAMGWTSEDVLGKEYASLWPPEYQPLVQEAIQSALQGSNHTFEAELLRRDGRSIVWSTVFNPVCGDDGNVQNIVGISTDITHRQLAQEKLLAAHQQLLNIIEFLPDATFVIDQDRKVIAWNRALEEMTGVCKDDIIGKGDHAYSIPFWGVNRVGLIDLISPENEGGEKLYDFVEKRGHTLYTEVFVPQLNGGRGAYVSAMASPLFGRYGDLVGAIESIRDITHRKKMEEQLKFLGLHDQLTGLYNRAYFEQEMLRLEGGRCRKAGIIVCDVDGLKIINDTLGHDAGDALLTAAAAAIRESFRQNDMVARIGGDEFAVLLSDTHRHDVEKYCSRIRDAIARHNTSRPGLPLSISIGFAVTESITSMTSLFKEADNNMYKDKLHHGNSARGTIIRTLVEAHKDTLKHAELLWDFAADLARAAGLPEQSIPDVMLLAQLHDIGNVGIADSILLKTGPLTPEETRNMKRHCEIGHRIALSAPELIPIADWILKHHEWWNGQGYPSGLKETEIPLQCRILAIVDAHFAMTSKKPYRRRMSQGEALAEIKRCSGTQFDPELVEVFIQLVERRINSGPSISSK